MRLIDQVDALLLDLDGTVWEGGRPLAGAPAAINNAPVPAIYVTNNASRPPHVVAEKLTGMGIPTQPEMVLTSAQAAIDMVAAEIPAGSMVYVLGSQYFKDLAAAQGWQVASSADDGEIAAVFHGHNPATGWAELSEAALAIARGARYIASNLDTTLPQERGFMVGNGSMVAAVVSATGVKPQSAGKPGPAMFHTAAKKVGAQKPLAVGDRLDTDLAGGVAAGMPTFHTLTGVSGPQALLAAPASMRPTYLAADLRFLYAEAEQLLPGPQQGFTATVVAPGVIELAGGDVEHPVMCGELAHPLWLTALRTVLAVAWADQGDTAWQVQPQGEAAQAAVAQWW